MTIPESTLSDRQADLPSPELVGLVDASEDPSEGEWWQAYGGQLDVASGVIAFPLGAAPPCPFAECLRHGGGNAAS